MKLINNFVDLDPNWIRINQILWIQIQSIRIHITTFGMKKIDCLNCFLGWIGYGSSQLLTTSTSYSSSSSLSQMWSHSYINCSSIDNRFHAYCWKNTDSNPQHWAKKRADKKRSKYLHHYLKIIKKYSKNILRKVT